MISPPTNFDEFNALLEVVKALRSEHGCPWDKEQTHKSLATFAIEEAFELAEAIELENREEMISELGDLLLQVALHSEIGRASPNSKMSFNIKDVIYAINEKMVRRHPHVFALESAKDSEEVLKNWAEIKKAEKQKKGIKNTDSFDIPIHLPSLMRSQKIGEKTKTANFDWQNPRQVIEKLEEEIEELKIALSDLEANSALGTPAHVNLQTALESEMGDVLFCCAQIARHLKLDAESSLRIANRRFERRFFKMLELVKETMEPTVKPSALELEDLWKKVKSLEKQGQI